MPHLTTLLHRSHPVHQFVIPADSHGRGTAPRVMNGLGGDYTPGECKAPSLLCDKSAAHTPYLLLLLLQPLLAPLPGIILLCDEIDPLHAGHVREN